MSKNQPIRLALASPVALAALATAVAAQAQSATPAASTGLSEVVVTAQRRSENLQVVPVAVNALTGGQLEAMGGSSSEALAMVAGVVYNPGVAGGAITIRGISGTNSGADEPGNAIYIDGVYQFAPTANLFQFNAVERIEVLKGPQGTLFGRNSAGGVIQVITRDPGREAEGEAEIGYGNYATLQGNVYFSAPLTDTLAVNFAAYGFDQQEGWGKNVFTGKDVHTGHSWGARGKLKWASTDGNTDALLSLIYNEDEAVASSAGTIPPGILSIAGQPSVGVYNSNTEMDTTRTVKQKTAAVTVHHDFGGVDLTSITAYDQVEALVVTDGDGTPLPLLPVTLPNTYRNFTQELRLQSDKSAKLQWIVGGFYLDGQSKGVFRIGPVLRIPTSISTKSYAAFAQATYPLTERTKITAGIRYTKDTHEISSVLPGPVPTALSREKKDGDPSWRLAIDHQLADDVLIYASYSRGFKSGVFNPTSPANIGADPTTLDAYEIGLKSEFLDHRLRVNGAIFYYDYKKVQAQLFDPVTATAYQANVADARTYGAELDLAYQPIENLTLTASLSVLDAKFKGSNFGPCFAVPPPPIPGVVIGSCPLNGNRLPFSPEFASTVSATYRFETEAGDVDLTGTYSYNDGYFTDPSNFDLTRTKAYNLLNATVTWTSPSERLHASLWGKNLLDERRIGSADVGTGLAGAVAYPLAPLTYGVTVGMKL